MIHLKEFAQSGELFDGRYKLLRPLSTAGGSADVWLALDVNTIDIQESLGDDEEGKNSPDGTGMKVAIKVYRPKNALDIEGEQRFRDEYKIVYSCHHENLLQPSHFSIFQGMPYLVMPFCSEGSSEKFTGKWTSDAEVWKYIRDVASGLAYLHANNPPIIHQDIKPGNILIDDNQNFSITDFGISSKFDGSHQYYYDDDNAGTLAYMAPERFTEDAAPLAESDIWALGATVYELLMGDVPFGEDGGQNQPQGDFTLTFPKFLGPELQRLIKACLDRDPAKRPTAQYLSEAARLKEFPIKRHRGLIWKILLGVVACVAAVAIYLVMQAPEEPTPPEVYFDRAMAQIDYPDADSVKAGVTLLDSLAGVGYLPAIRELALTYGWYGETEPASLKRKKWLGIELGNPNVADKASNLAAYLPVRDGINQRAIGYYNMIVTSTDSTHTDWKMDAAYRLGVYYLYYTPNPNLARKSFLKCKEFATELNNKKMIENVDIALSEIP